jgi:anti-sigma factor RsiW
MCPDPQLLSIYVDGELPSPWKEKMEAHLKGCPLCSEKLRSFQQLHILFKKDTTVKRTYVERVIDEPAEVRTYTEEEMQESKEKIWNKLKEKRRLRSHGWKRRLSIPIPAAAAAAIIITLITGLWIRSEAFIQSALVNKQEEPNETVNFILAAEDEGIPNINTAADFNGFFQYLTSNGTDIIILQLPPERNFSRAGEPAIIRAADYHGNIVPRRLP